MRDWRWWLELFFKMLPFIAPAALILGMIYLAGR